MKILVDENIAYAKEAYSAFGEVRLQQGRVIRQQDLHDIDVLLVRSVTQVNQSLLANTPVKFVGTATIGVDHIDLDYLSAKKIAFKSCAGCNANAVAEYVVTALLYQEPLHYWQTKTVAIIGYGNVGKALAAWLGVLKINYIVNDPPLEYAREINGIDYVDLETALRADAITLHVPLTKQGQWPTYHLLNKNRLAAIQEKVSLINTCRGEVIDNQALINSAKQKNIRLTLDVWEREPEPLLALVEMTDIATPHIAGYSLEGKVNGTRILHDALSHHFNKPSDWRITTPGAGVQSTDVSANNIEAIIKNNYRIQDDVQAFKNIMNATHPAEYFDGLRKNYSLRNELGLVITQNL